MRGSCLCGEVRYEVQALASAIQHCSCHTCRKAHAAAFNTAARVRPEQFRWLAGEERLRVFESSPGKHRYFCGNCGTHLLKKVDDPQLLVLRVATLDDDPQQTPAMHIWASHAVPWLSYGPEIAVHAEAAPKAAPSHSSS